MIPKKLHYIWLGKNPLPEMVEKCIESWKEKCPNYEIVRWDESNLDINCCDYCKEAYENKKYAFASDVLRYKVLYEQGGIYLDVDVMLYKNLDNLLTNRVFMGFEENGIVNPGLICGAEKGNEDVYNLYSQYKNKHFVFRDGKFNYQTICDITTKYLKENGLTQEDQIQKIKSITIYPVEYFCPYNFKTKKLNKTENSYSVHLYLASWTPKLNFFQKIKNSIKVFIVKIIKFFVGEKKFNDIMEKRRKKRAQWQKK